MPVDLADRLSDAARQRRVSVSEHVARLIEAALEPDDAA
jgi:class 3 adenylate cyclase